MENEKIRSARPAALFFDIDGTLLSERTDEIPESAIRALQKARENGHYLFINTGRTFGCMPEKLGVFDFDGYLCGCGTYVRFQNQVLLESHLPQSVCAQLASLMYSCGLDGALESTQCLYLPSYETRFPRLERDKGYYRPQPFVVFQDYRNEAPVFDKMFVYSDEKSDVQRFIQAVRPFGMEAIDRGNSNYEIVQAAYTKGTACAFVQQALHMELEDLYVFGDSSNDMTMFTYARHTVAMQAHNPVLDPYTEFVTKAVEDDGIAHALAHYGLIQAE